jgi:hypothetical protein
MRHHFHFVEEQILMQTGKLGVKTKVKVDGSSLDDDD